MCFLVVQFCWSTAFLKDKCYNTNIQNNFKKKELIMENKDNQINVFDVANYIITKSKKLPNNNLTHMKLHKIIYYSYISYLIQNQTSKTKRLIFEKPKAWKYGPVFGQLFHILRNYYEKIITKPLEGGNMSKIDKERAEVINNILEKTKNMNAVQLSEISHNQPPWDYTFYYYWPKTKNNTISDDLLLEFFSKNELFTQPKNLDEMFQNTFPDFFLNE
ncbi:phage-associated protein [Candidatus Phytoplasma mali]|uniref:Phage-associated protein n=1 Tax=Phytoplasma mali (strain AT) TaxID=482235 RepID=B3QZQ7_PHYMT|nr:type II toxin-antitoxin system antitoxin SocA domain-containing protein [Candidatus Phytoplasma mali]CAP18444.1 phage-associated protein [Candidatus Phytoplasma mali]